MTTLSSIESVTWDNVSRSMPELTTPYLPPRYLKVRPLLCGGDATLPRQDRNPAITPWPSSGNTTRRSPRCNVHERKGESIGLLARKHDPDTRVVQQLSSMPQNRYQQPQAASHTFTRPSLPISDDLCRLFMLWRSQLSRHRGQTLGLALCVSTHGSFTCIRQEATGIFRDIRHRGRIGIRWRPRIHGRVHPAVPTRLGSCPPPLVGSLSAFQTPGPGLGSSQPSA